MRAEFGTFMIGLEPSLGLECELFPPPSQKKEINFNVCFPDFSGSTVLKEKGKILEEISLYHNTPGNTVYIKSGLTCMIRYFSTYNSLLTQS